MLTTPWLAKNKVLRTTAAAKENVAPRGLIPRPVKGAASKGFKLQAAMGLEDDDELYMALRVSPSWCIFVLSSKSL